jgi:cyclic di-GMP phosphodiesterase
MNTIPCVVVAGDSAESRQQIAAMLRDEPWHLIGAPDGDTVMDLIRANTADLVLMESHMRGADGVDVVRRVRRNPDTRLLPIVLISPLDDVASRVSALDAGADDFLTRPLERNELRARIRSLLKLKTMRDRLEDARQVIFALANAAEKKDLFTVEHTERVADSASELARRLLLASDFVEQVRVGGLIHDVGKLAVPDSILNKPGPLTRDEFELVKTHTLVGADIVSPLAFQPHLTGIVRNHHERYDGGGYPDGLAGEAIPFGARIVAVADAYDAMVNQRSYRLALPHATAVERLLDGRDRQWDGRLVDEFVAMLQAR